MLGDSSALQLVLSADPALLAIVRLSLWVSLAAVVCAALAGLPLAQRQAFVARFNRNALAAAPPAASPRAPWMVPIWVMLLASSCSMAAP